ncbi:restriction endonuclease subunit S [Acinetobacter radioresistens]|uniref:restriction endonuclease subunit S n=1 Tax=Acinetobacter radioresistens TaxID=40216 RepID=UPI000E730AB6|nr:restriction endonuclease subunit S [Acinetobacter radioresistens]RJL70168.1 restriction endonuclease subunit S [Acinetobacter radioresistens]
MEFYNLGGLVKITSGFAFKSSLFNSENEGMPLIRIRDVVRGYSDTFYTGEYKSDYIIENGDALIGMDGEFNLAIWNGGKALLNQRVCKIESIDHKLDQNYLIRFLPKALKLIEDKTPFVTVKHLSVKEINSIQIPLPPLEEQRRIASILDKADAIRQKRQQTIAKLEELLLSEFLKKFSGKNFKSVMVQDLLETEKSMRTGPFGSQLLHSEFVDEGIAVLGIDNAVKNQFQWGKPRFMTEQKYKTLSRYTVKPNDVLITIMGTCGRCAVVPENIPKAINTKHLCCITLDKTKCEPEFLHSYFLMHPTARNYLESRAKGAIMDGLNMGIIKELPVELPSLEDQKAFVKLKKVILSQKQLMDLNAEKIDQMFGSLQQKAFSGTL